MCPINGLCPGWLNSRVMAILNWIFKKLTKLSIQKLYMVFKPYCTVCGFKVFVIPQRKFGDLSALYLLQAVSTLPGLRRGHPW